MKNDAYGLVADVMALGDHAKRAQELAELMSENMALEIGSDQFEAVDVFGNAAVLVGTMVKFNDGIGAFLRCVIKVAEEQIIERHADVGQYARYQCACLISKFTGEAKPPEDYDPPWKRIFDVMHEHIDNNLTKLELLHEFNAFAVANDVPLIHVGALHE